MDFIDPSGYAYFSRVEDLKTSVKYYEYFSGDDLTKLFNTKSESSVMASGIWSKVKPFLRRIPVIKDVIDLYDEA